jgi:hypothetical protein
MGLRERLSAFTHMKQITGGAVVGALVKTYRLDYRVSLGFDLSTDAHQALNHHCNGSVKLISTPLFRDGMTTAQLPWASVPSAPATATRQRR